MEAYVHVCVCVSVMLTERMNESLFFYREYNKVMVESSEIPKRFVSWDECNVKINKPGIK